MGRELKLGRDTVLRHDPRAEWQALADGRILVRHPGGSSLLGGIAAADLAKILAWVDGRRTAEAVCDALAAEIRPATVRAVLRQLWGELLQEVDAARQPAAIAVTGPAAEPIRSVGILGGGTAGYLAALALRARFPDLAVTLIESPDVPVIGVGEATTPLMPQFLHGDLGLDIHRLFREVRPTFKLGIRFLWGAPATGEFLYPFGPLDLLSAAVHGAVHGHADLGLASPQALLMAAGRVPFQEGADGTLAWTAGPTAAYHLDNARFVAYLQRQAVEAGVARELATVAHVERRAGRNGEAETDEGEIGALVTTDGRRLAFDLYLDCTGFRSLLLEQALGSPWVSFGHNLRADRAIVGTVAGRPLAPYTTAETMSAGWCWSIPQDDGDHRGYVFSSAHLDEAAAEAEMRAANPGLGDTWSLRFRSGRHAHFVRGNVFALGNAYGFVEPLESTALHLLIRQLGLLLHTLADGRPTPAKAAALDRRVAGWWDYLHGFLALHYRHNRRHDSAFWRACRAEIDLASTPVGELEERFRRDGPLTASHPGEPFPNSLPFWGDPLWGPEGIDTLLLGQGVPCPLPAPRLSAEAFTQALARARTWVHAALPHAEALARLQHEPAALDTLAATYRAAGPAFGIKA